MHSFLFDPLLLRLALSCFVKEEQNGDGFMLLFYFLVYDYVTQKQLPCILKIYGAIL